MAAGKGQKAESFHFKLENKSIGRRKTFLQTILTNHVFYFSVATFCGSFLEKLEEKFHYLTISCRANENYPTTSVDKNCIEFEFQTHRKFYTDLRRI